MRRFARLLERLVFTPSRNGKLRLMESYFREAPDPDRGWGLAALTGELVLPHAKPGIIRALAAERTDPVLFGWSYDFVGDLAETVSLVWPGAAGPDDPPDLDEVVRRLSAAGRTEVPGLLAGWLDRCEPGARFALLKLITGGFRVGVSARLARTALASYSGRELAQVEELWHGVEPPYGDLFAWLDGQAAAPAIGERAVFRPLMLSNPVDEAELAALEPGDFAAEWKWDGIRVQLVARGGERRLFSRTGDDVGGAFPEIVEAMGFEAVLDGELLVGTAEAIAPFNDLQQRLNRKTVSAATMRRHPGFVRLYDILLEGDEDLRALPFDARRARLEAWYGRARPARMDLSPLIPFAAWPELASLRAGARESGDEGLMLKRRQSPYIAGRPKGHWFKWKRDPLVADCVLMYAQRGHGRRSSYYSDYTFGAWQDDVLVPVGKAYFGFTDEELRALDRWVRENTVARFGPVREVEKALVLEVAFDSVHRSARHRSGLAMRFPRIGRIRWDKPAAEADRVESLARLVT